MDKNTIISNKIRKLMNEGKSQAQSVAIAYSMYEREKDKMQEGGYSYKTMNTPQGEATFRNSYNPAFLNDVENIQRFRGEGYGNKVQNVDDVINTHSWFFDSEEKKNQLRQAIQNKGSQQIVSDFQNAYNNEVTNRAKLSGMSDQEIANLISQVGFDNSGLNAVDGKFGAYTSSRPMFDFSPMAQPQTFNSPEQVTTPTPQKEKMYYVKYKADSMKKMPKDFEDFWLNETRHKDGYLVTEKRLRELEQRVNAANQDLDKRYNNAESKNNPKAQERYRQLQHSLEVEEYKYGGELPKYQFGSYTFGQPNTDFSKINPTAVSTKQNPLFAFPQTTYGNNVPDLGMLPNPDKKATPTYNIPGQIPSWDVLSNRAKNVVPTTPVIQNNTNIVPTNTKSVSPTPVVSNNTQVSNTTPVVNPNNSASFYKGMFSQQPFTPDAELGFNTGEQYYGLGRDENYVNQLSEKSLTAGEDWKNANPLPQGVFEKDLGYESNLNYTGQNANQPQQYNDFVKYNTLNPYGGVDPLAGLSYGLYNFGAGNNAKGLLGVSRFGLGALREGLSAYGAGKNDRQVWENYQDQQFNQPPKYEYMKEGGKTIADMMTSNYIAEDPNPNAPKNVEIEAGEYAKNSETGNIAEAVGEKHKNGGVKVNLPSESKILSDFTKIGASNVKKLKEQFDVKIKPTDTFADVLDKYKKKIGAKELEEDEVEYMKEIEKQLKANISEKTKQINLDFLGKELEEVQAKKTEMQKKIDEAFEILFNEQEKLPKKNSSPMMQEGGNIPPEIAQLAEQYGIPVEKAMELIAQQQGQEQPQEQGGDVMQQVMSMLQQGASPEQVVQELVSAGYPQEEAVAIIEQVMTQSQGSPQQEQIPMNEEGMPMAQGGGYTFSTRLTPTIEGYDVSGRSVLNQDQLSDVELMQPYTGQGYGAKMASVEDTIKVHDWYFDTEEKKNAFREASKKQGNQPEVLEFQKAYNEKITEKGKQAGLSQKDIEATIEQVGFSDKGVQKLDGKFGAFTSTRPLYDFTKKEGKVEPKVIDAPVDINLQNNQPINRQVTKNIVPLLPYFPQLPPNSMQIPKRQQVDLSRIEPVKIGVEPNLAEAERARIARAMSYASLSPEVASAMQSADLMATQQANNQAISAMEVANAQAQFQADQFNAQQRDRETLTNLGLDKQYEREMFTTLANQDTDWRRYYNAEALQQKQNYMDIQNLNLVNALTPNYQYNLGTGQVDFLNPATFGSNENSQNKQLEVLMNSAKTPEERMALQKQLIERMNLNNKTT